MKLWISIFLMLTATLLLVAYALAAFPAVTQDAPLQAATQTNLPSATATPALAEPGEEPGLPLGVSSLIGAILLAIAYWLNKRSRSAGPPQ